MKRQARIALLAVFFALPAPSCATFRNDLPTVLSYVQDGVLVLDAIEAFTQAFFLASPNPQMQAKIANIEMKAKGALDVALRLANGVGDLDKQALAAAFKEFQDAYAELLVLVGPLGVSTTTDAKLARLTGTGAGSLRVPEPLAMHLKR